MKTTNSLLKQAKSYCFICLLATIGISNVTAQTINIKSAPVKKYSNNQTHTFLVDLVDKEILPSYKRTQLSQSVPIYNLNGELINPVDSYENRPLDKGYGSNNLVDKLINGTSNGSISGRLTDAVSGEGISGIVYVYTDSNIGVLGLQSTIDGYYQSPSSLGDGSYNVFTSGIPGYNNELFGGTHCFTNCSNETSTLVVVDAGETENIDFSLDEGLSISGSIKESVNNNGISNSYVYIHNQSGDLDAISYVLNENGDYQSEGLEPGAYFVLTYNNSGYVNELYDQACLVGCDVTTGTPVQLSTLSATNIDFILVLGATLSGDITDSQTGNGLSYYEAQIYDSIGNYLETISTDKDSYYETSFGLPTGGYYVKTNNNQTQYIDEIYDNIPCVEMCDVTTGQEIVVTDISAITGIDFALEKGLTISGKVVDSDTQLGLESIRLTLLDINFTFVDEFVTDINGDFSSQAIESGTYYLETAIEMDYINQIYNDINCGYTPCEYLDTSEIIVTNSPITGIDFNLDKGANISGMITEFDTGMPIVAGIQLYNSNKELLAYYASDVKTGQYTLPAKPNGDYYLVVNDFLNDTYISQIYDDIICENLSTCDATIGDAVIISDLNNVSNINFILKRDVIFTNGFGEAF